MFYSSLFGFESTSLLNHVTELSIQYRDHPHLNPIDYSNQQQALLHEFKGTLPFFQNKNSVKDVILDFIKCWTNQSISLNQLIDSRTTFLGGKSKDPVYFVYSETQELIHVIKVFRSPFVHRSKFLAEISSLDFLRNLSLEGLGTVSITGVGQYFDGLTEWGLMLETPAEGIRMDQLIYRSSKEEYSFKAIIQAFNALGSFLAQFHHAFSVPQWAFLSNETLILYTENQDDIFKNPTILSDLNAPSSMLDQYLKAVLERAQDQLIPVCYRHGDAHLGNIFYDSISNKITFVDTSLMLKSFDINLFPRLDGISDLIRADEYFQRKAHGYLTQKQIDYLLDCLHSSYENFLGYKTNQHVIKFYRTYYKMKRLLTYSNYKAEENLQKRARSERVYKETLDYFNTEISIFSINDSAS